MWNKKNKKCMGMIINLTQKKWNAKKEKKKMRENKNA